MAVRASVRAIIRHTESGGYSAEALIVTFGVEVDGSDGTVFEVMLCEARKNKIYVLVAGSIHFNVEESSSSKESEDS